MVTDRGSGAECGLLACCARGRGRRGGGGGGGRRDHELEGEIGEWVVWREIVGDSFAWASGSERVLLRWLRSTMNRRARDGDDASRKS
jgi:hypothetical protein